MHRSQHRIVATTVLVACGVMLLCLQSAEIFSRLNVTDEVASWSLEKSDVNTRQELPAATVHPTAASQLAVKTEVTVAAPCVSLLQQRVTENYLGCVDTTTPATAHSLHWRHEAAECKWLKDYTRFDDPDLMRLMLARVVEAHGDSTLRELIKLLIGGLGMQGTLDKRDASATLRYPKFFVRVLSNATAADFTHGRDGINVTGVDNVKVKEALMLDGKKAPSFRFFERECADGASGTMCPLAYRVMFRFDFVPASFTEPLVGALPSLFALDLQRRFEFFGSPPAGRWLLLATGSHTAKLLAMNQSTRDVARSLSRPQLSADSIQLLFDMIVRDTLLFAGKRTVVSSLTSSKHSVGLEREPNDDPVVAVVVFLETLECGAMVEAKLAGFRDMAPYCDQILQIVRNVNELFTQSQRALWAFATSSRTGAAERPDTLVESLVRNRVLQKLVGDSTEAAHIGIGTIAQTMSKRLIIVPALECHVKNRFQFTPSKPFCTRDGIHLRTKFIRLKLNLLLNVMREMNDGCLLR